MTGAEELAIRCLEGARSQTGHLGPDEVVKVATTYYHCVVALAAGLENTKSAPKTGSKKGVSPFD